jgi:competence protein ComEC
MGYGIEWMDAVALWVASLPGAVRPRHRFRHRAAFSCHRGPVVIGSSRRRCAGAARCSRSWRDLGGAHAACRTFLLPPTGGHLRCAAPTASSRSITPAATLSRSSEWLAADADGRDVTTARLARASPAIRPAASANSVTARLVAYDAPDAFEEDCRHAPSCRDAARCAARLCGDRDRTQLWRERGALALRRDGSGFAIESARPPNFDRPWAPHRRAGFAQFRDTDEPVSSASRRPAARCHAAEDIEADPRDAAIPARRN